MSDQDARAAARRQARDELLARSQDVLLERVTVLENAALALLTGHPLDRAAARKVAHQLASLGVFGLDRGGALARRAVDLLDEDRPLGTDDGVLLAEWSLGVRSAIEQGPTGTEPDQPGRTSRQDHPDGGCTVLLVEDDVLMVALVERALTDAGYAVSSVGDGASGVAAVLRDQPDVVVLDIDLPGLDGFGVLRQLAAAGALPATKVLVLSARGHEGDVVEALELGASDHVLKPFSLPVLLARLDHLRQG